MVKKALDTVIVAPIVHNTVLASANPGDKLNCSSFSTPKQPRWRLTKIIYKPGGNPGKRYEY
jgi:hypothetical protein